MWPAYPPNLNPTEAMWYSMKDYIQINYLGIGNGKTRSLNKVRVIVEEACNFISEADLAALVSSMPARC